MARTIRRSQRDTDSSDFSDEETEEKPTRGRRGRSQDEGDDTSSRRGGRRSPRVSEEPKGRQRPDREANSGWDGVDKVKKALPKSGDFANDFTFKDKDGDEIIIKFLEDQPYDTIAQHWLNNRDGKKSFTCHNEKADDDKCPLCDVGDRPNPKAFFNIISLEDPDEPVLLRWAASSQVAGIIKEIAVAAKTKPLSSPDWYYEVKRTKKGSGRAAKYTTTVQPVKTRDLAEDYDIEPLTDEEIDEFYEKRYTFESTEWEDVDVLEDVAAEIG